MERHSISKSLAHSRKMSSVRIPTGTDARRYSSSGNRSTPRGCLKAEQCSVSDNIPRNTLCCQAGTTIVSVSGIIAFVLHTCSARLGFLVKRMVPLSLKSSFRRGRHHVPLGPTEAKLTFDCLQSQTGRTRVRLATASNFDDCHNRCSVELDHSSPSANPGRD
ncbi:unnamed protein product [Protopolystoma xenopodis]|uniref:Uncharacterized protein n=1 Tax=Protopolystoma xenopodis TaxID=117903 RepID=A0A3S5FE38_9PLAT|nr:unnamed protein product [Protopolystoma xenopodis]